MRFKAEVLETVKWIPKGRVSSYAEVARALGRPGAARAVGQALRRNPSPIKVPCHRIVMSDGRLGGYALGTARKKKLLIKEGVKIKNNKINLNVFGVSLAP